MIGNSTPWVAQYLAAVGDMPSPGLDRAILAAAARRAARRRTARHLMGASLVAAVALVAINAVWNPRPASDARFSATGYGVDEGISLRYLMQVQAPQFTGPGVEEGMP